MFCDICGINKANIHFKQIINNQTTVIHLCEQCAEEKGFSISNIPSSFPEIFEFFSNLFKEEAREFPQELRCPSCGMTFEQFQKKGRLGCSGCFESFKEPLNSILQKIHGGITHLGKVPTYLLEKLPKEKQIEDLKSKLREAVAEENYEEAARIRDMIKQLKC
ncbi:TPA: hypothetical protein DCX16_01950 [bacterium]|nr:hypothetical protein [bacterium]